MDRYVTGENVLFVKACAQWKKNCLKTASYDKKKSKDSGKWPTLRYHISELHLENENKMTSPVYFNKENKEWM